MCLAISADQSAWAQGTPPGTCAPRSTATLVIDTIIVTTHDVFPEDEELGALQRLMNGIHVVTKPWVVRNELLFRPCDTLDSFRLAESERRLRDLNIFQRVTIDTATGGDRFALRVVTQDGWTLSPKFALAAAGGTVTGTVRIAERKIVGTANLFSVFFNQEVDRSGWEFTGHINRFLRSPVWLDGRRMRTSSRARSANEVQVPKPALLVRV